MLGGQRAPDGLGGDLGGLAELTPTFLEDAGTTVSADRTATADEVNPEDGNRRVTILLRQANWC